METAISQEQEAQAGHSGLFLEALKSQTHACGWTAWGLFYLVHGLGKHQLRRRRLGSPGSRRSADQVEGWFGHTSWHGLACIARWSLSFGRCWHSLFGRPCWAVRRRGRACHSQSVGWPKCEPSSACYVTTIEKSVSFCHAVCIAQSVRRLHVGDKAVAVHGCGSSSAWSESILPFDCRMAVLGAAVKPEEGKGPKSACSDSSDRQMCNKCAHGRRLARCSTSNVQGQNSEKK